MAIYIDKFEVVARKRSGTKTSKSTLEKFNDLLSRAEEVSDLGADYIIIGPARGYVIERKTVSDLLNSVFHSKAKTSGRLYDQVKRIIEMAGELSEKESVPVAPLLVVEGNIFVYNKQASKGGRKTVPLKTYRGILLSVVEMGACVVETKSFGDTIDLILHLEERSGKQKKLSGLNVKKSLRDVKEEAFHMLFAVSGLGEKKASKLLEKYGTAKAVVNLDEDVLIKELGPKIGKHFYEVVNTDVSNQERIK